MLILTALMLSAAFAALALGIDRIGDNTETLP